MTNNPLVMQGLAIKKHEITYISDASYLQVLTHVRDRVHVGARLLTHPLAGSVKPGQTPYKTVALSNDSGAVDQESLHIIEESIQTCCKFYKDSECAVDRGDTKNWSEAVLKDLQLVDYDLVYNALSST